MAVRGLVAVLDETLTDGLRPLPGAVELLRDARRMGVRLAVIGPAGHSLAAAADVWEPAADLPAVAARLGLDPADCAVIGGDPADAVAAGMAFWGVQDGRTSADLWAAGADRVFPDADAVWRHLDDLLAPAGCLLPATRAG